MVEGRHGKGGFTCVSQIASRSLVLVIDLLALGASSALDTLLIRLLSASTPIKAGCAIGDDIAALARSNPTMQAFHACSGLLDLRTVFVQHVSATGLPVRLLECCLPWGPAAVPASTSSRNLANSLTESHSEGRNPHQSRCLPFAALDRTCAPGAAGLAAACYYAEGTCRGR